MLESAAQRRQALLHTVLVQKMSSVKLHILVPSEKVLMVSELRSCAPVPQEHCV